MFGHQRNIIFLVLFNLSVGFCASAQDSLYYWKFKSLYSLSGTQTSFVNWNAGGRNNISLIGSASASAYYTQDNIKWTNDLSFALGGIKYFDNNGVGAQKPMTASMYPALLVCNSQKVSSWHLPVAFERNQSTAITTPMIRFPFLVLWPQGSWTWV